MGKGKNMRIMGQLLEVLVKNGWSPDRWGHYKKEIEGRVYRYRFNKTCIRLESQLDLGDRKEWRKIRSGYYKDLSVIDGKIHGLSR